MTPKYTRPTDMDMHFHIAEEVAHQATCPRKHVGCVIVPGYDGIIISGWNAPANGVEDCEVAGCLIEGGHCVRTVHAEIRALANAARIGLKLNGASAFCTLLPCISCMQALAAAGVFWIFYDEVYEREEKSHLFKLAPMAGVHLIARKKR